MLHCTKNVRIINMHKLHVLIKLVKYLFLAIAAWATSSMAGIVRFTVPDYSQIATVQVSTLI